MTDINTELEAIAAEVFADDDSLEEDKNANLPKRGAAPGDQKSETLPGERQDLGPAVVSPDASSDMGKAAEKKAKKASPPGKTGGRGLASKASGKTVAPTGMDGEVGDKLRGEAVEDELDEAGSLAKARAKEKALADVGGGTRGKPQVEPPEDEEEDEKTGKKRKKQNLRDRDDEEEANEATRRSETIEDRVAAIDLSDDVNALTGGEGLSEEFKTKAATIFEAALKSKIRFELIRLDEEYAERLAESTEEIKSEISTKVDDYLAYVVEEWMKKNEVALEHKIKTDITEAFITGLKSLFEEHNISVPDDKFDMLDAAAQQVDELETDLNEKITENVELSKQVGELKKHEILLDVASDLADTEVEKFVGLVENIEYESAEDYTDKLNTLKDSYFPKAQVVEEVAAPTEDDYVDVNDTMAAYMTAISRTEKRAAVEK